MFSCLKPFFSSPSITADLIIQQKENGNLVGVVFKRFYGKWSARLGELTNQNQLHLYKTATDLKSHNLSNMKKLLLSAGQNSIHVKMTLKNGEKLYLKIKGPDRLEWGARITQCKFSEAEKGQSRFSMDPCNPPSPMLRRRMGYLHYVTDSSETASSLYRSISSRSSVASMQSTQQANEEETHSNGSIVAKMVKIFEPNYQSKRAAHCC